MTKKKPKPPDDLWETLDHEVQMISPTLPPGAFSFAEFKKRYGINDSVASGRIIKLLDAGKIRRVRTGWYVLTKGEKNGS